MIDPGDFYKALQQAGVQFYAGVPDSLLKDLCAYFTDHVPASQHLIAANEGAALGLAAGWYLGTGKPGVVYLQNSGLGNLVNPLTSLTDPEVYSIPALLIIGWRGEPDVPDEPQHVKQGRITPALLDCLGIAHATLPMDWPGASLVLADCLQKLRSGSAPVALLIRKGTFAPYKLQTKEANDFPLTREGAISTILESLPEDALIVSTTGMISREVYEHRKRHQQGHDRDFLTVGSMGHSSQIALGLAKAQPNRSVLALDGDGAALMHLGSLAINGQHCPPNLRHVILNNGAHDSVGGQPTVGFKVDLPAIALACGYKSAATAADAAALEKHLHELMQTPGPCLLEVRVSRGSRPDLGRPKSTPQENKQALMQRIGSHS